MAKRKSAWDSLKNILPSGTARHRDVYEGQMLVRGDLPAPETMGSRAIFCAIVGVFVFLLVWCSIAAIQGVSKSVTGSHETNPDPAASWIHVASHYESKTDPSNDKLTLDEFALLRDAYESREDINVHDEPVAPEDPQLDKWIFNLNHYEYKDDPSQTMTTSAYNELKAQYEAELEEYNAQMAEYESYKRSVTNPDELYSLIPAHYRAVDDFSNAITEADYNKLVEEYEKKLSKNKISQDLLEIPVQPVNPEDLYILKQDGEYSWYMNKLDGSTIPVEEYVELVNKYEQDMADYNTAYVEHRVQYHDGDVEGKKVHISILAPNSAKVCISLLLGVGIFGVLYGVLRHNLSVANQAADIEKKYNDYKNDQHIMLPEEIQRLYDWFPDVGAHSSVQVSSLISHMALLQKGTKLVDFAERVKEDILDEDGEVVTYRGEILLDEEGNPVTKKVPLIDEDFMDSIYDASQVPKNGKGPKETYRQWFDPRKIEYNPGNKNRDKLKGYDTVADLINGDWELPLYEPQRPAGAYIVDTAPVNTIQLLRKAAS